MFTSIKNVFKNIVATISSPFKKLFARSTIDITTKQEIKQLLLEADFSNQIAESIIKKIDNRLLHEKTMTGKEVQLILNDELHRCFSHITPYQEHEVMLLVGTNGSGKTTIAAKLAAYYKKNGGKVLLIAADTFRAAASEQLKRWADSIDVSIYIGSPGQDPAAVVYQGCEKFKNEHFTHLIIDTAGRLQTKINLMQELSKMYRIVKRLLVDKKIASLLIVDSMLGQNVIPQVSLFNECIPLTGCIITKVDGLGKAGALFSVFETNSLPIAFISYGETIDSLSPFDQTMYINFVLGLYEY